MHTEPRGQGGLPGRLRLNDLLGRARTCDCTEAGNRATAGLSCRVHGGGNTSWTVRARRANKLTARRSTLARSANHY